MSEKNGWRTLGLALAGGLVLEVGLYVLGKALDYYTLYTKGHTRGPFFKTLFFPDAEIACRDHFTRRHGCTRSACKFSHNDSLSYGQLLKWLSSARRSVDVAVYCITGRELVDVLVELHEMGVVIRVITDDEASDNVNSQISYMRSEGIQVRLDMTPFYMHHKFFIVDEVTLINGSFNWSKSAITGNNENVTVTNHRDMVRSYQHEYNKLWGQFDPKNYKHKPKAK